MNRINSVSLYISGFIFLSILLLMQLCNIIPCEMISQIPAQMELFLHLFMLTVVFKIYTRADSCDRTIVFWLIPINIGLFLNDLIFYYIIYFSENYTFTFSFLSFVINITPYSIWIISTLIFLLKLVKEIFASKNFLKMFSMLMLINCLIILIFFNSVQSVFNSFSWQNISLIISSLIELIIYNLSILCLIYSEKRGLSLIVCGLIILLSGDFIISYSFLAQTNSIATYGELFWFLGILCILFGMIELQREGRVALKWLRSTKSIKGKLAFWAFGISLINILPFFVLAYVLSPLNKTIFLILPPFIMLTSLSVVVLSLFTVKHFEKPFKKIADNIESLMLDNDKSHFNKHFVIEEFVYLQEFILKVFDIKEEKEAAKKALVSLTTQVAHDIRSPLAAINAVLLDMTSIDDKRKMLIRNAVTRINDIANNILLTSHQTNNELVPSDGKIYPESIFLILNNIISEKNYEYSNAQINIRFFVEPACYSRFALLNRISFMRVLSNLINNSVESITSNGQINVTASCHGERVKISIEDNGCGISPHLITKIKERGFSSKINGAGLGLSYAKDNIERINGEMHIVSNVEQGTCVSIFLPCTNPPLWFCNELIIREQMAVIILDNDPSQYKIWKEKLSESNVLLYYFDSEREFSTSLNKIKEHCIFLIDYEFTESQITGLDVIHNFNLYHNSIIVTNDFHDERLRYSCEKLGLKIIPKPYLSVLSIVLEKLIA